MSAIATRRADLADLAELTAIFGEYRRLYGCADDPGPAREFLCERMTRSESIIFMAWADGTVLGFAQLFPCFSSVSLARTYLLNDLYVRPERRRKGVGRQLLAAASQFAQEEHATHLTLTTEKSNAIAQLLYKSAGWARDEQFCVYHFPVRG